MTATLSCRDVSRTYTGNGAFPVAAVRSVDLDVALGQFVAIQGPSGSGKTTLLGILAGIEQPDEGKVEMLGHDLSHLTAAERARLRRRRVGVVFQSFGLVPSLSAGDNVALPLALEKVAPAEREARARAAMRSVELEHVYHARIDELSGAQRQRVGVARAIVAEPALVLADEPTGSLDDETGQTILRLLRDRAKASGASLVLVTHDSASAALADERYRMLDGRLIKDDTQ